MQFSLDFQPVHLRENSPLSQSHLDANRERFTASCFEVLKALVKGLELTTDNAKELCGTRSLPRRLKDLRDMGISISDEWILINGRKSHMKWYMSESDKSKSLEVLLSKMREAA